MAISVARKAVTLRISEYIFNAVSSTTSLNTELVKSEKKLPEHKN
jgi:hypothetical protein